MKKYFAVFAMLFIFAFNQAARAAAPQSTPELTTKAFYTWFIKRLSEDKGYPVMDKDIYRYVAPATVEVLRSDYKENRFAERAEYFTNVQDFDEKDWTDHIFIRPAMMLDDVALVAVTFGSASTRKINVVFLRNLDGIWKITKVVDTGDYQ
jgi:hypothetical protein